MRVLVHLLLAMATASFGASFNCRKASLPTEKKICSDAELSALDGAMGVSYKKALSVLSADEAKALRDEQKSWIEKRATACSSGDVKECLFGLIENRSKDLLKKYVAVVGGQKDKTEEKTTRLEKAGIEVSFPVHGLHRKPKLLLVNCTPKGFPAECPKLDPKAVGAEVPAFEGSEKMKLNGIDFCRYQVCDVAMEGGGCDQYYATVRGELCLVLNLETFSQSCDKYSVEDSAAIQGYLECLLANQKRSRLEAQTLATVKVTAN